MRPLTGKTVYQGLGQPFAVVERVTGGGADAAFAALNARGTVVEGMGLSGYGAHSNNAEYVQSTPSFRARVPDPREGQNH